MSTNEKLSRREFFKFAAAAGAVTVGAGTLLMACESSPKTEATGQAASAGGTDTFSCEDASGLSEGDVATRTVNEYVDKTPKPAETCLNCALYTAPEAGSKCGGCVVVKGTIHPDGWCKIWAAKPA